MGSGAAFSGGAAAANSASTVFYNPAGMSLLKQNELLAGVSFLYSDLDFGDRASVLSNSTPISGGDGGNGGGFVAIPHVYAVYDLKPDVKFGIGLNAPYGLVTQYDEDHKGRYNETLTSFKHLNLNPSLSWRMNTKWSFGAGLNFSYAKLRLRQAVDFGTTCSNALGAAACLTNFSLVAGQTDGSAQIDADDYSFGLNFGVLFQPRPGTRIGAHYRSKIEYNFRVDGRFTVGAGARAFLTAAGVPNAFTNGKGDTEITIPETASISVYHDVTDKLALMSDLTWTRWSRFDELRIEFDEPSTPTNLLLTNWHDTIRIAFGGAYRWDEKLTLRSGLAFEQGPIDTPFRGPGIPDSDRFEVAIGAGYRLTETISLESSYVHLFFRDGATVRTSPTGSLLIGDFRNSVDVVTLGLRWTF